MATTVLLGLAGCGQTGRLYLPTEPAAAKRATLPESLWPAMPKKQQENTSTIPQTPAASSPTSATPPSSETLKP